MLDLYEELRGVRDALDAHGVEYAICGALGMAVHGFVRATVNIDLLVPCEWGRALPPLSRMDAVDGDRLSIHPIRIDHEIDHAWRTRMQCEWLGRQLTVVSREGLIELKKRNGRSQDLADIARIPTDADYSDRAINLRLNRVSQLRRLCLSLGRATPLSSLQL
jgi:hypothetical protein